MAQSGSIHSFDIELDLLNNEEKANKNGGIDAKS